LAALLTILLPFLGHGERAQALEGAAASEIEARLQTALEAIVASDQTQFPGAILYVSRPQEEPLLVAAGVADTQTGAPLAPTDRFRAGSVLKPFVAAVILQLVEEGSLSLDDTLTKLLPKDVTQRFPQSDLITLKMLLNHTSGIPEWLSEPVIREIAANPRRIWRVEEFLDLAAAQPSVFGPGEGWSYSNTDYNLLGLVIERVTGNPWRDAVRERIIEPLGLISTTLPEPGDAAIQGAFMHGYGAVAGQFLDLSFIDPSMADAAGGGALVTTAADLAAFFVALREGRLFTNPATLADMTDFVSAPRPGGQVGYGLGLEKYIFPPGLELIGHMGGTAGYRSFAGYFPQLDVTIALALSVQVDPSPVIAAVLKVIAPDAAK
jgi:D-alanyl-D-alanine carboxypeptidase